MEIIIELSAIKETSKITSEQVLYWEQRAQKSLA